MVIRPTGDFLDAMVLLLTRTLTRWTVLALCALVPSLARGQSAALVPLDDPTYSMLDELDAVAPVPGLAVGQRPYSRREVARVVVAFSERLNSGAVPAAVAADERLRGLLASLTSAYASEIALVRAERPRSFGHIAATTFVRADLVQTNSAPRAVPDSNGLGGIWAFTNPLSDATGGRAIGHGTTAALEPFAQIGVGDWLALGADARAASGTTLTRTSNVLATVQTLYARAVVHNVALEAGLDERQWGQGGADGMLLSANPRPLPAVSVGNDTAFRFPWLLSHLGPARFSFEIADLGATQNFPGAKLVVYKLTLNPIPRLELGAGLLDQMGGRGAPPLSFGERVKDLIPYIILAASPGNDKQASNKIAALDLRYRFAGEHGVSIYYEVDPDDFDVRRLWNIYWQDSGQLLGATIDRIDSGGRFALDLQVHRTSLRLYEHAQFSSGVTYREAIIGDPLGPNANAGYATLTTRLGTSRAVAVSGAYERRDGSQYTVFQRDAHGNGWRFIQLTDGPRETRMRVIADLRSTTVDRGWSILPRIGLEHVLDDAFVIGRNSTYAIASLSAVYRF